MTEYQGEPEEFPMVLGVTIERTYSLPGLAGERARCYFLVTDDHEIALFIWELFEGEYRVHVPESLTWPTGHFEMSNQ